MDRYVVELTCTGLPPLSRTLDSTVISIGSDPDCDLVTWEQLELPSRWRILHLDKHDYRIETQAAETDETTVDIPPAVCSFGEWVPAEPCKLRVTPSPTSGCDIPDHTIDAPKTISETTSPDRKGFAAPEIHITTCDGLDLGFRFPPAGERVVIGRKREGTDLIIADPRVSARHLCLYLDSNNQPTATDLGSRHGTYLNEQRITGPTTLHHNDELRIGGSTIRCICYGDVIEELTKDQSP